MDYNQIVIFPKGIQFDAFRQMFGDNMFWNAYSNTLFIFSPPRACLSGL
ncbi:MAG: hypothetical protein IKN96_02075 [Oscillibacter sp.]|nr:hypothetical protein [Oscillibacter sp.]